MASSDPAPEVQGGPSIGPVVASHLAANYPFLAICTHEEERALDLLNAVARDRGRAMVRISLTETRRLDPQATVLTCLDAVIAHETPAVFAWVDLHPWLADPLVVRSLRDLRPRLEEREQTIVFLSPDLDVPMDLATDVVVIPMPLPGADHLRRLSEAEVQHAGMSLNDDVMSQIVRAVQGMTAQAARRAIRRALQTPERLSQGDVGQLVDEKRRLLQRSELLDFLDAPAGLDAVGGLGALKAWLRQREAAFGEKAREFGLPMPRGLMLIGVQGCGKSLVAKSIARLWNLPLARLDLSALFTSDSSPESNLRRALRIAEALAPVILWVDEIDKAFRSVGTDAPGGDELHRLFATFITWLQEKEAPAFVVATANAVDALPPELMRKGRFDETFFLDLPGPEERADILAIHLRGHGREPDGFDRSGLAARCEHFTGAELEQVIVSGLHRAFVQGRELTDEDLVAVAGQLVPLYRTYEDHIKGLRTWAKTRARKASQDSDLLRLWKDKGS